MAGSHDKSISIGQTKILGRLPLKIYHDRCQRFNNVYCTLMLFNYITFFVLIIQATPSTYQNISLNRLLSVELIAYV